MAGPPVIVHEDQLMFVSINRAAIIVRPGAPYIAWACGVDDDPEGTARYFATSEPHVYLVDVIETDHDGTIAIDENWHTIFEEELAGWLEDDAVWPTDRTREMFMEWFDVSWASSLTDISMEDLEHNDY